MTTNRDYITNCVQQRRQKPSKSSNRFVAIEGAEITAETAKAVLCRIEGQEYWIAFSLLADDSICCVGDVGTLIVPQWLADENNLEYTEVVS